MPLTSTSSPSVELTRYEISWHFDRNMSRPVVSWFVGDHLERQDPDLILSTDTALLFAAYCPIDDQTLETLRGWTFA